MFTAAIVWNRPSMIWLLVRAIAAGLPIGLQLGLTGTGGAILGLPLMVYIVGLPMQQAAAMSLIIVAISSLVGAWEYSRQGFVNMKAAAVFGWAGMLGAWGGALGHRLVREEILLILFGLLLLCARALVAHQRTLPETPAQEQRCVVLFPRTCWLKVSSLGVAVGAINGLFGVGGGFMIVPALIVMLRFPARVAVGTSLTVIALISVGGIVGHLQIGSIQWELLAYILAGSVAGILLGVRLGQWLPPVIMNRFTATITISIALSMIVVNTAKMFGVWS
jgi:uncharacterized membrane protein YfcA